MSKIIDDLIANTPNTLKNKRADDNDLEKMSNWITSLSGFHQSKGFEIEEFNELEERLNCVLPVELKILYNSIGGNIDELSKETVRFQKFQLLNFEKFWIEKDVIVKDYYTEEKWFKTDILIYATASNIKKPLYGVDLKNGWNLLFEKEWFWQKDDMPLFQKLITLYANIIIANKENIIKTKVKGVAGIKRDNKAEKKFESTLKRLSDFEFYEHTVFYNEELDLLGWFRAGNTPDFLVGSNSKSNLDNIIVKFDFTSAKYVKENKE